MKQSKIQVIDSHTGGEPTRVVVAGGPQLKATSMLDVRAELKQHHDSFRRSVILEPRGSDIVVGALLCESALPNCVAGVVFFNNVGYLGMCGHGAIGVVETLAYLGRIKIGRHQLETPVGVIEIEYHGDHKVTIQNVPSYRLSANVSVEVDGVGRITGDVAWGGNWFFICHDHGQQVAAESLESLTQVAWKIRCALVKAKTTGADGAEIDHIELVVDEPTSKADSRNFVLCPGKAFDRSPCGTGTSAKLACLAADNKLKPGDVWKQASVIGSVFEGSYQVDGNKIIPSITGTAYVTCESSLVFEADDPFVTGIVL